MRPIDADAAIADLDTVDPQFKTLVNWCKAIINAQFTLDCKGCKYKKDEYVMWRPCYHCMRQMKDYYEEKDTKQEKKEKE